MKARALLFDEGDTLYDAYKQVLRKLGVKPCQAFFVGNSLLELRGAKEAGMKTIAFNANNTVKADFVIQKFSGLLDVVGD